MGEKAVLEEVIEDGVVVRLTEQEAQANVLAVLQSRPATGCGSTIVRRNAAPGPVAQGYPK